MKKIIFVFLILGLFITASFAQEESNFTGVINGKDVNVRAGANINFEIITKLNKGDFVEVLSKSFDWYKIKLPKDSSCFVNKSYVLIENDNSGKINANRVNIRAKPTVNSTILGQFNKNDNADILAKEGNWYKIGVPNNCFGWVNVKYISYYMKKTGAQNTESVVKTGLASNAKSPKTQIDTPIATGIIKSCGKFLKRPGTYKLIKDSKVIYYLQSNGKILDSFLNSKVNIWGRTQQTSRQKIPVIVVEKITALE
ncbi:MAG: SH3 domain-containing protein [Candidatus Omnitrophota bacterium]